MGVLESNLFKGEGENDLKDCARSHAFNFFQGKADNARRTAAIITIRTALDRLGFPTTDPEGVYGSSTSRAVQTYKGPPRMILGPGQTRPDAVVGVRTIARLDRDIRDAGLDDPAPGPLPGPGTRNWRFNLAAERNIAPGRSVFSVGIISAAGDDAADFNIETTSELGDLDQFKGLSSGSFVTAATATTASFIGADCLLMLAKISFASPIAGFMRLTFTEGEATLLINLESQVLDPDDQAGAFTLTGALALLELGAGSLLPTPSPSASSVNPLASAGIRAHRRHLFRRL